MWHIVPKSVGESSIRRSSEDIPYAARETWKSTSRMKAQECAVEAEDQSAGRLSLMTGDGIRMYLCAKAEAGQKFQESGVYIPDVQGHSLLQDPREALKGS